VTISEAIDLSFRLREALMLQEPKERAAQLRQLAAFLETVADQDNPPERHVRLVDVLGGNPLEEAFHDR
jgi:hypothetical protein